MEQDERNIGFNFDKFCHFRHDLFFGGFRNCCDGRTRMGFDNKKMKNIIYLSFL